MARMCEKTGAKVICSLEQTVYVLLNDKSRMKGDFHVRFREKFEVKVLLLTRLRGSRQSLHIDLSVMKKGESRLSTRLVGMCLTEYDEVEQRQFDREEGREEGEELKLIKMICKKILKNKTPEEIAEDLDEDYPEIKIIYDEALRHAPEYEAQDIYSALHDGI